MICGPSAGKLIGQDDEMIAHIPVVIPAITLSV